MLSLFDKPASTSRSSSGPLSRSLDRTSISQSSPARSRQGSFSGLRRPKSPGRRLTDAYVRTTSSSYYPPTLSDSPHRSLPVIDSDVQGLAVASHCSSVTANNRPEFRERTIVGTVSAAYLTTADEGCHPALVAPDRSSVTSAHYKRSTSDDVISDSEIAEKTFSCPKSDNLIVKLLDAMCRMLYRILIFTLVVALIIFSASFCLVWMRQRCEHLQQTKIDFDSLRESLSNHVIGQDLAISKILSVLKEFQADQFAGPAVMWCVGWTGSGKSISLDVFRSSVSSHLNVQYFIPTFIPSSEPALSTFVADAVGRMNPCLRDIVIVDGWDGEADEGVLPFLAALLARVEERASLDASANQLLVVVAGVQGSKAVNREYLSQRLQDIPREKLPLESFIGAASGTKEYAQMEALGPVSVVPYFPLESEHVMECVRRELGRQKRFYSDGVLRTLNGRFITKDEEAKLVASVLERLPFMPQGQPLVSASGCKRVLSTIRIMLDEQQQQAGEESDHHEL